MRRTFYIKLQIGALALPVLLASVGTSMANMALPSISIDFKTDFSTVKWIILSYLISSTLLSLKVGHLGDVKGRKKILLVGIVFFSASSLLAGLSKSFDLLILARVLQGIGASALTVLPISLVSHILPKESSGRTIGLLATMSAVGTASGPTIGGFLISLLGWRSIFHLMGIMALLIFLISKKMIPSSTSARLPQSPPSFAQRSPYLALLDFSRLIPMGFNLTVSAIMMTTLVVGPFFLNQGLGLDPSHVGLIMSVGPITSMISGIPSGYLVDRYSHKTIGHFALAQLFIGTLFFVMIVPRWGALGFAISASLLSVGYQLFQASNSTGIMQEADADKRGLVSGALSLSRNLGLISGTYLMGGAFDLFSKTASSAQTTHPDFVRGFQFTFLIPVFLITSVLLINLINQKRRPS